MNREYHALSPRKLEPGAGYAQPSQRVPNVVRHDSPATDVMTDLTRVVAVIILPGDSVDEAHHRMIQRGVRLLLVVDQDRRVHGVVTANDVLGEKPVTVAVQRGVPHSEVQVRDVMTPADALQVLTFEDVAGATVGHVIASLKSAGRQHGLVVDEDAKGRQRVRGIFSATQIARQLGVSITTSAVARTFAEIETALR